MNIIKSPEITFIRGNCGRLWGCKDGKLSGPIVTMGDMIFEKERRKEWMRRNKQENCEMDHKCFQDFINRHEWPVSGGLNSLGLNRGKEKTSEGAIGYEKRQHPPERKIRTDCDGSVPVLQHRAEKAPADGGSAPGRLCRF